MQRLTLWQYQYEALEALRGLPQAALFIDPGLGKTAIILALLKLLKQTGRVKRALIIAPIPVIQTTWPEEIAKWYQFRDLTCTVMHGKEKLYRVYDDVDIYLVNPENFIWVFEHRNDFDALVIDESTKFKSTKAKRWKFLVGNALKKNKKIFDFDYRYIMTGTPMPKSYEDLFGQMAIVNPDILGHSITKYKARYFFPMPYCHHVVKIKDDNAAKQIEHRIAPYCYSLQDSSGLVPELVERDVELMLPKNLQKQYKTLEKELYFKLDRGEKIFASSATVSYSKCRQFTSGELYIEDDYKNKFVEHLHDIKIDALSDRVDELQGKPVLVNYFFKHELTRLKKLFGRHAAYTKEEKDTNALIKRWNRGEIEILVVHQNSFAFGLNMQRGGNHIIWFSLPDDSNVYTQFNRRLQRQGAIANYVVAHRLIMRDTVDEVQRERVAGRIKTQSEFMDALERYRRKQND